MQPEKFWNRQAPHYDQEEMKDRDLRLKILTKTRQHLKKEDHVLDYGCATGIVANAIAGDVNTVFGIDISPQMIRIAQERAAELGITNARYKCASIFDETLNAGAFDAVLAIYMLHLLEDMPAVLERIHGVVRPGGLFIAVTPCLGKRSLTGNALLLAGKIGLIPEPRLFSIGDLQAAITLAGFDILETECLAERGRQYFTVARRK